MAADPIVVAAPAGHMMMMPMNSPLSMLEARLEAASSVISQAIGRMLADAAQAPGRLTEVALVLTGHAEPAAAVEILGGFALLLVAAAAAAWLVRRLLTAPRHRLGWGLERAEPVGSARMAMAKLEELTIGLAPVATFLVVAQTLTHVLFLRRLVLPGGIPAGTDAFGDVATGVISSIVTGWVTYLLATLPLAAGRPGLRIVPLGDAEAAWSRRTLGRIIWVAIGLWALAFAIYATHFGMGLAALVALIDGLAVTALCLAGLHHIRRRVTGFAAYWHKLALVSVFGLEITWTRGLLLIGEPPLGRVLVTVLVLMAIPAVDGVTILALHRLTRRLASRAARRRTIFVPDEHTDQLTAVERPVDPSRPDTGPQTLAAIARFSGVLHDVVAWCVLFAAAVALAQAWGLHLQDLLGPQDARTLAGMALDVAVAVLVGWYVWRMFEASLGIMLARDDGAQSRSKTVEPLLRSVGVVVIGLGALMVVLSHVGISIAPLLASAGVVGIAVGFGAQTLVKDLFSGTCFLIEDVFRIGEYIEAASAKGTVEKITFRTVALRHQNGPLHFVPYGSLGTVRNNSRDWVIDKFEIPLPIDTDSEQIRRMVKKIGQEMQEDPALAPLIMAPLKAKLYRIDPGVKLFRCKVQTQPGLQFELRTDAYRRIEAALKDAGIPFASSNQSVILQAPPPPTMLAPRGLAPAAE